MKKYIKIYLDYFDYCETDVVLCEICGKKAVDIHHIEAKGLGGSKTKDYIENLIAVCRNCHVKCHDNKEYNKKAREIHLNKCNNTR